MRLIITIIIIVVSFTIGTNARGELIYGKGTIAAFSTWDVSLGAHGPEGEFFIDLFDVPSLKTVEGVGISAIDVEFHSVLSAPENMTPNGGWLHLENTVTYVVLTLEGNYAKLHIGYYNPIDEEGNNAEWVYQTDGSTNLDYLTGVEESTWGAIKQVFKAE